MAASWGHYHRLRPDQIEDIKSASPIAFVPWGALEWHSYHNPIGLDGMIAEDICAAVASSTGGLVLPAVYIGTDTIKVGLGFPHTIEHQQATVTTVCNEFCEQLSSEGFKAIVVITGHCGGGHREALQKSIDIASDTFPDSKFKLIAAFDPIQDVWAVNHAAIGETSLQMAVDSSNVDLGRLPEGRAANLEDDGVWGDDPSTSSIEKGNQIRQLLIDRCTPIVMDLLK